MLAAGYSYRYAPLSRLSLTTDADWLSPAEQSAAERLRHRGRRAAWLAGRLLVKQLLAERLQLESSTGTAHLAALEIRSVDADGRRIRPHAVWRGRTLGWSLSISHSRHGVLAAVAPPGVCVGVDLVASEERLGRGFAELWFAPEERSWLAETPVLNSATVWGAKEAAYKALNQGEPFTPRQMRVKPLKNGDLTCRSSDTSGADCRITVWWTPQAEFAVLATCSQHSSICNWEFHHD